MKLYLAEIAAWLPMSCTDFSSEHSAVLTQLHGFQLRACFFGTSLGDLSSLFHCVTWKKEKWSSVVLL